MHGAACGSNHLQAVLRLEKCSPSGRHRRLALRKTCCGRARLPTRARGRYARTMQLKTTSAIRRNTSQALNKPVLRDNTASKSLTDNAYDAIKHQIMTLGFRPGEYLNEARISKLLNIGRTPVHHAV